MLIACALLRGQPPLPSWLDDNKTWAFSVCYFSPTQSLVYSWGVSRNVCKRPCPFFLDFSARMGEAYRQKGRSIIRRPARWGCVFFLFFLFSIFFFFFYSQSLTTPERKPSGSEHIIPFYPDTVRTIFFAPVFFFFFYWWYTYIFPARSRSECVTRAIDPSIAWRHR